MPLPTTEIQAFGRPTVKDGVLSQPVTLGDGSQQVLAAPAAKWRKAAWEILAATEASKPRVSRNPILKPAGRIL